MPTCFNCGGEIKEHYIFCPDCGTQLKEMPPDVAAAVAGRTEEERLSPMTVDTQIFMSPSLCGIFGRRNQMESKKMYKLLGPDGKEYFSETPGTLGGNSQLKIYGRLNCSSALRAIRDFPGSYEKIRVFFADEETAQAAGYRPCGRCMREQFKRWKAGELDIPNKPEKKQS